MQALRDRCAKYAADGRFELFKSSKKFDADEGRMQLFWKEWNWSFKSGFGIFCSGDRRTAYSRRSTFTASGICTAFIPLKVDSALLISCMKMILRNTKFLVLT